MNDDTPLHWACWNNKLEVVKELVERGADICSKGEDEETPFDQAWLNNADEDADEVADYLLEQYKKRNCGSEKVISHSM